MMALLENVSTVLEVVLNCLAVGVAAGWRRTDRYRIGAVVVAVISLSLIVVVCNHIQTFSFLTPVIIAATNIFFLSSLYANKSYALRCAGHVLCITYILTIEYILCVLYGLFFGWDNNSFAILMQPGRYRATFLIISKTLDVLLFWGVQRLLRKMKFYQQYHQVLMASFVTVVFFIVQGSFSSFLKFKIESTMLSFSLLWLLLVFALFGSLGIFGVLVGWRQQKQKFQQLKTVNQAVLADYQHMQDQYRRQAGMQHDITNQLLTLRGSKVLGDPTAAKAYIDQLLQRHCPDVATYDTGCEIIDSILNFKAPEAQKDGIDFIVHAQFTENTGIAPVDICTVLTNQLDNAIEACRGLPPSIQRQITVKIRIQGHMAFFVVENTMDHDPHINNENLDTTKTDTDRQHGLGLYNIRETAERYNGHMTIHYKEGVVRSTTFLCFK